MPDFKSEPPPLLVIVWAPQEAPAAAALDNVLLQSSPAGPTAEQPFSSCTAAETAATSESMPAAVAESGSAAVVESDTAAGAVDADSTGRALPDSEVMRCDTSMPLQ